MLFSSSDEEIGALLKQLENLSESFEKNLMMMHIKSNGHLSLSDVYQMTYKMREIYTVCHNEYVDEQNKEINSIN